MNVNEKQKVMDEFHQLWMKNMFMTKFMNKLDDGTKHEILF